MLTKKQIEAIARQYLYFYKSEFEITRCDLIEWIPVQITLRRDNCRCVMNFFSRDVNNGDLVFAEALVSKVAEMQLSGSPERKHIFEIDTLC